MGQDQLGHVRDAIDLDRLCTRCRWRLLRIHVPLTALLLLANTKSANGLGAGILKRSDVTNDALLAWHAGTWNTTFRPATRVGAPCASPQALSDTTGRPKPTMYTRQVSHVISLHANAVQYRGRSRDPRNGTVLNHAGLRCRRWRA